jgi:hypothetical protein
MFSWWQEGDMCPPIEHFLASSYHEDAKKMFNNLFVIWGMIILRKTPFVILHHNIELQNLQTFAPKKNSLCGRPFRGGV